MSQWYHARDGRQHGPVPEDELRRLVSTGALGPDDLVWSEGMVEWVAVRTLPQLAPEAGADPSPPSSASNPYQPPASPMMAATPFAARGGGDIDLGEAISQGWTGFMQNALLGSLGSLIYLGITLVLGFLPIVSLVAPILVGYPLLAGMFYMGVVAADNARGNPREVVLDDLFIAFRVNYGQAVLYSLILFVGFVGVTMAAGFTIVLFLPAAEDQPTLILLAVLALSIPIVYFSFRFWFGFQFLTDKQFPAVDALGASWRGTRGQLLSLLGLSLVAMGIYLGGILLLLVGIFPAFFLICCISGAAYRQIAGD